jgi:hypothetical protein
MPVSCASAAAAVMTPIGVRSTHLVRRPNTVAAADEPMVRVA